MTPTNTQGSEQDAKAIVKVLKYYPGITSHMDLTVKSPLVVELAALIKSDREVAINQALDYIFDHPEEYKKMLLKREMTKNHRLAQLSKEPKS